MIRELTEQDRENTLAFLEKDPSLNIFLIGDIFHYGFEREFQQLWGDFDSNGELRAVLLRYYGNYLPYAPREFDIEGFVEIMDKAGNVKMLSGTEEMVSYFKTFPSLPLDWATKRTFHLAQLNRPDLLSGSEGMSYTLRPMLLQDIEKVAQLHDSIEEFNDEPLNQESLRQTLESRSGRGMVVEHEGRIIGMVQSVAENPYAAMLIGVGTDTRYRKQGLASRTVSHLCQEMLAEGKKVCLFYDNPDAGNIYKRLGFRDIGFWSMVKGNQKEDIG